MASESRIRQRLKKKLDPNSINKHPMDEDMFNTLKYMINSNDDFNLAVDIIKKTQFSDSQIDYILKSKKCVPIWKQWMVSEGFHFKEKSKYAKTGRKSKK